MFLGSFFISAKILKLHFVYGGGRGVTSWILIPQDSVGSLLDMIQDKTSCEMSLDVSIYHIKKIQQTSNLIRLQKTITF